MDGSHHGTLLASPIPIQLSTLAIPSLEPIPGSTAPTPSLHESIQVPTPPPLIFHAQATDHGGGDGADPGECLTPSEDDPSSHTSSLVAIPGSYFPPSQAGLSTPPPMITQPITSTLPQAEKPRRPAPIAIPTATPDEPLFSSYPDPPSHVPSRNPSKGKGRSFPFPIKPALSLTRPSRRLGELEDYTMDESGLSVANSTEVSTTVSASNSGRGSPAVVHPPARPKPGRRRASTYSGGGPPIASKSPERRSPPKSPRTHVVSPPRTFRHFTRRRRASMGGRSMEPDFLASGMAQWPSMAKEEARRYDCRRASVPFSYQHPAASDYTVQSVSTIATVRPDSPSSPLAPNISPRRSSLVGTRSPISPTTGAICLGLSAVPPPVNDPPIEIVVPDDGSIPHNPPPRRSSLDYGSAMRYLVEPKFVATSESASPVIAQADVGSLLSASLTGTDTSASVDFFSNTPSSKEHPLSSANTSLSRSAKSSKEGGVSNAKDAKDAALNAIRLQRSLEWEARQNRHRRRLEKRKMILLELVETEVTYADDLKTLVHIYIPQLYALPSVNEKTADKIARNAKELVEVHEILARKMVEVLKEEQLGYEPQPEPVVSVKLERVARRLAALFVQDVSAFAAYNQFCAGSILAASLVRHITQRPDYDAYERRCQIIAAAQPHYTLKELLVDMSPADVRSEPSTSPPMSPTNRSRLRFRDFLIMPIQRVCRYPLLLNSLLGAATAPSPTEERANPTFHADDDGGYDVGVDVERALGAMRGVAEEADEARRVKEAEIKSATIIERLEPHPALSQPFLKGLGTCRLIGSLDVLHHHPTIAPLMPPVKVKYLAAFLYRGYLILAKVKRGKVYEAKHFLPLEVFELIDITEGFLPHSLRLALREHNFDLAASCEIEKEVWASALSQARDESLVPPFELPASVSLFAARARRVSTMVPPTDFAAPSTPLVTASKRHTLAVVGPSDFTVPAEELNYTTTPATSPTRTSFSFTPDRHGRSGQHSTILLRRASATQRLQVDRGLLDVFSESCATARSKAQLHHALFLPDVPPSELRDRMSIRDSTTLRRRRSFLDSRQATFDIAFTGEIKGSIMPIRPTRSHAGGRRRHRGASTGSRFMVGSESATEVDTRQVAFESADETATASEYGTMTRVSGAMPSRTTSVASFSNSYSPAPSTRRSMSNLRKSVEMVTDSTGISFPAIGKLALSRRKTASSLNLNLRPEAPHRAKSMPVSPKSTPKDEIPPMPNMLHLPVPPGVRRAASSAQNSPLCISKGLPSLPRADMRDSVFDPIGDTQVNEDRPTGAWSSIKRSMSIIRDGVSTSNTRALVSIALSEDSSGSGEGSGGGPDIPRVGSSQALQSDPSLSGDEDDRPKGGSGPGLDPPKKRKSVRIFQQLSRFTPM